MTQPITKAVFPVAGLGTRFLPATKASPKEMLPIVDKPLIQYAVEEAVEAGITEMIFVTGRSKRAIEDHFDKAYELETELEARGKTLMLELLRNMLPKNVTCIYIRQAEALGLGHAVLCAKSIVKDEPFAVILADDLIDAKPGALTQMVAVFQEHRASVIATEAVAPSETSHYGIVDAHELEPGLMQIDSIVEKPDPALAPSNIAVVGRYILTPHIFSCLENVQPGKGGEIQLTDGIAALMAEEVILAYEYHGKRYDCGSKLGYMQANVEYALRHPEISTEFTQWLNVREKK
ncbi:MAG: UTP--glucose-1-phosphate uridylyltransferase GalU [Betaproteobacteria bacterium]|nr:UTP--glucose-1-phosphate uridylyltransferase GalU [Betaproteobacteria bacterium]